MNKYPVKEIVVSKTYVAHVFIRAESDKEALEKARILCKDEKFEKEFIDKPEYDIEKWNAYAENIINDDFIY